MDRIPNYVPLIFLGGSFLLVILVLVRTLGSVRVRRRDLERRLENLYDGVRGVFPSLERVRHPFGGFNLRGEVEGKKLIIWVHEERGIDIEVRTEVARMQPCRILYPSPKGIWARIRGVFPLEGGFGVRGSSSAKAYASDAFEEGSLREPLVVLKHLPGVVGFTIEVPSYGSVWTLLRFQSGDWLQRVDLFESLVSNLIRLHEVLAGF